MENLRDLYTAILKGDLKLARTVTAQALEEGIAPQQIIDEYMAKAMREIGDRFEAGKAFVPELLMSARAMKGALDLIRPVLATSTAVSLGRIVVGTVKGDLHDIGKNLVASMLEGSGFEVINLGVDVSADKFAASVKENNAQIVGLSALLTTTMDYMKDIIDKLEREGLRDRVKVMIGGAPITEAFALQIGADGYSDNANSAVVLAKKLISA